MTLLRRCLFIVALGLLVPITNCTLITDVDRSLIDEGAGGTGGDDAPNDNVSTNGESSTAAELDDAALDDARR